MKRYEKFVQDGENKVTYIPIPEGYRYEWGVLETGCVIEREIDKSQFVWIPVSLLDENGVLDEKRRKEKFGIRLPQLGSQIEISKIWTNELAMQYESVKKYGGFYISRYNISKNEKTGRPQSVKNANPYSGVSFNFAKATAAKLENVESIKSHLVYGAEYDSVLNWFYKSGARTCHEIYFQSTWWGHHAKNYTMEDAVSVTGYNEKWCTNNIYDFAGNVAEWTQEQQKDSNNQAIRGGSSKDCFPVGKRRYGNPNENCHYAGFRAALWLR